MKGLECSERSENLTIRKSCQFWIEIDTQFFSNSKKLFFEIDLKIKSWKSLKIFRILEKVENSNENHIWFSLKFLTFFKIRKIVKKFQLLIFKSISKNIFLELEKNLGIYFDSEFPALSIGDVFGAIRALLRVERSFAIVFSGFVHWGRLT